MGDLGNPKAVGEVVRERGIDGFARDQVDLLVPLLQKREVRLVSLHFRGRYGGQNVFMGFELGFKQGEPRGQGCFRGGEGEKGLR